MPALEEQKPVSPPLRFFVKSVGDLPIYADVHLPTDKATSTPHNVLLYIHGGAFCAMDSTDLPAFLLRWARRIGAIIVSANYRLAPQAKLGGIFEDVRDCLTWVAGEDPSKNSLAGFLADKQVTLTGRVAVLGGSAGGWLTLLLASLCHPAVKVAAAIYPMTNVEDDHYHKGWDMPNKVERHTIQAYLDEPTVASADPDFDYRTGDITGRHNVAIYMAQNALWQSWLLDPTTSETFDVRRKVTPKWPPVFLLHGADDVTILPSNSLDMAHALDKAGVQHQLYKVPNVKHFFDMITSEDEEDKLGLTALMDFVDARLH